MTQTWEREQREWSPGRAVTPVRHRPLLRDLYEKRPRCLGSCRNGSCLACSTYDDQAEDVTP